jgi:hypothetical protein
MKGDVMASHEQMRIERENKAAGKACKNAVYKWHQIDGYCKECRVHAETDKQIQERRAAKGYR